MYGHLGLGHLQAPFLVPGTRLEEDQGQVGGAAGPGGAARVREQLVLGEQLVLRAAGVGEQLVLEEQPRQGSSGAGGAAFAGRPRDLRQ